jgi:YD repeat-containing protein
MRKGCRNRMSLISLILVSGMAADLPAAPAFRGGVAPAVDAISRRRAFQEPLVPIGGLPSAEENQALGNALDIYLACGDFQSVAPLEAFLERFPKTPWRATVLSGLGWVYRETGALGRAQRAWREVWDLAKGDSSDAAKAIADWSVTSLADLMGRVGKRDALAALLKEVDSRPMTGTAGTLRELARQQLGYMDKDPANTFRCGPMALGYLAEASGRKLAQGDLAGFAASVQGTNLAQLQAWGRSLGMDLVGVRLDPGTRLPVPSLLHLKEGHFATVVRQEGDRFLVRGYLKSEGRWLSRKVLEEECGAFALVEGATGPSSRGDAPTSAVLAGVWGTGATSGPNPEGPSPGNPTPPHCPGGSGSSSPSGMATYSLYLAEVSLLVEDRPLWYTPPIGPEVNLHVYYNQWEGHQPQTFTYWNLGSKWTVDWLSYVTDDPSKPGQNTTLFLRGGGISNYTGYNATTGAFAPNYYRHDILVRTSGSSYERRLPDGGREEFTAASGSVYPRKIFLTQIIDSAGNALTFTYDAQMRLTKVTDALGQVTQVSYGLASDPLKITQVTDPFARTATFTYDTTNHLVAIKDMIGITSQFAYGSTTATPSVAADFLNSLITPYGTTTFVAGTFGSTDRWIQVTDPLGQSERVEYHNMTGSMPISDLVAPSGFSNTYLYYRNTFYWDKRAMALGSGDWTLAKIFHFLHSNQDPGYNSPLVESEKLPLDSRIWYRYGTGTSYYEDSSSLPTATSRILDDGTEQRTKSEYNTWGKVTKSTDAVGRTTSYTYSTDGMDLLEVRNTTGTNNDLLARYTYNSQHKPLTVTDASGMTTRFTYNTVGQILTITNPKNEVTTLSYTGGYLTSIIGALPGATTTFTYDAMGRVGTVTSSDGRMVTTDYDNLDRPTTITYGDGTTEKMIYDRLDLAAKKDRLGRWTTLSYNPLRQLTEIHDASGRTTDLGWCNCGSLEQLTDPAGHTTNWWRDLQGRVIGKRLDDGSQTSYSYDSAGRLSQRVDAKAQVTSYQYWVDNNLRQVSYSGVQKATPTVGYTYDSIYKRLASMVDGFGTTTYAYYPVGSTPVLGAGRLKCVTGPFANSTITYAYDELGRLVNRSINGNSENREFDALGRLSKTTNALGVFQYAYQGSTEHLNSIQLPNGQKTVFTYFDAAQDFRLAGISNQKSDASVLSAFTYTYNADGSIKTWSQQTDVQTPRVYSFTYDDTNQLIGAVLNQGGATGALIQKYIFGYDLAGNRTSEQVGAKVTTSDYNNVNQVTNQRATIAP